MSKIDAKCKDGSTGAITASGRWLPCCNFPDFDQYNKLQSNKKLYEDIENNIFLSKSFSLHDTNDLDFHEKEIFKTWIDLIEEDYNKAPSFCKFFCSVSKNSIGERVVNSNFWCEDEMEFIENEQDLSKLDQYEI